MPEDFDCPCDGSRRSRRPLLVAVAAFEGHKLAANCRYFPTAPLPGRFDERRLERIARRLNELRAWRNAREAPVADWTLSAPGEAPVVLQPGALNVHCFVSVSCGAHVSDRHQVVVEGRVVSEGETVFCREGAGVRFT